MPEILRHGIVNEGGDFTCIALIYGADGAAITQATVSSIALTVTQLDDNGNADAGETAYTATPTVSAVVFDTLQTDSVLWPNPPHTTGYNFLHTVDSTAVPNGDADYQVDYVFTMSDASIMPVPFGVKAREIHGL